MEKRIESYILKHNVLTLATTNEGQPYCCSLFYAFDAVHCRFYFMSSTDTRHIIEALKHPLVAGTIVTESKIISNVKGLQFTGRILNSEDDSNEEGKSLYLKKYPFAKLFSSNLWIIKVNYFKMTDNTLGFGKKLVWQRENKVLEPA